MALLDRSDQLKNIVIGSPALLALSAMDANDPALRKAGAELLAASLLLSAVETMHQSPELVGAYLDLIAQVHGEYRRDAATA